MPQELTLWIDPDGTLHSFDDIAAAGITDPAKKKRVSHILPATPGKRLFFRCLRQLGGEHGIIADWTRRWAGPWQVILIKTGATYCHPNRSECVRWEKAQLLAHPELA